MALTFNEKMGKMTIEQKRGENKKKFAIDIWTSNAMACFTYDFTDENGEEMRGLYLFFGGPSHIRNLAKSYNGELFADKVVGAIELNTYHPQAVELAKVLIKYRYTVKCYYREPKKRPK